MNADPPSTPENPSSNVRRLRVLQKTSLPLSLIVSRSSITEKCLQAGIRVRPTGYGRPDTDHNLQTTVCERNSEASSIASSSRPTQRSANAADPHHSES